VESSPDDPTFHVVALSLPGFGFSTAPTKKGFGSIQYAEVCDILLHDILLSIFGIGWEQVDAGPRVRGVWCVLSMADDLYIVS
jgi:hypothetical protein